MSFTSSFFLLLFFPVFILFYLIFPKLRCYTLLIASYIFYGAFSPSFLIHLLFSTVLTYSAGYMLSRRFTCRGKKLLLAVSLILNFSVLLFYKYADFAIAAVSKLAGLFSSTHYPPPHPKGVLLT